MGRLAYLFVQGHHDVDVVLAMDSAALAAASWEVAVLDFQHILRCVCSQE